MFSPRKFVPITVETIVFLVVVIVAYAIAYLTGILMNTVTVANLYGGLGLLCYALTLVPGNGKSLTKLALFSPYSKPMRKSLTKLGKYRRQLGVAAFGFGLNHGVLILHRHADTWHPDTSYLGIGLGYWHGLTLITIMSILAFTSNNWCLKVLRKRWCLLHKLTYVIAFLMPWHIASAMNLHWTPITPIGLGGCAVVIFLIAQRYLAPLFSKHWRIVFGLNPFNWALLKKLRPRTQGRHGHPPLSPIVSAQTIQRTQPHLVAPEQNVQCGFSPSLTSSSNNHTIGSQP